MSRIHEALRKVVQETAEVSKPLSARAEVLLEHSEDVPRAQTAVAEPAPLKNLDLTEFDQAIRTAREIAFDPPADSLLVHPNKPREAPAEEFRTLRTRLNHLQAVQARSVGTEAVRVNGVRANSTGDRTSAGRIHSTNVPPSLKP